MSTKGTVAYGNKFHLYHEMDDNTNIYLQLDAYSSFKIEDGILTVAISIENMKEIILALRKVYVPENFTITDNGQDNFENILPLGTYSSKENKNDE